nr:hypothetical protein [Tanacetum cinerariifolium]
MADENVPASAPTRSHDQILPFVAWEFVQAIQTFLIDKANLGSPTKKGRKDKPYVIPYCQFTKIIICHLERIHNIHQRSASPFHLAEEDFRRGNIKFIPKGKIDEVFGMPIPDELISNNIRNAPYYNAYLEMVTKHDRKVAAEKEGKKKTVSAKQPKSKPAVKKSSKPAPAPKPKATKERPSKASTAKPPKPKPAKEKSTDTTLPQPTGKGIVVKFMSLESFLKHSQAHFGGVATRESVAEATQPLPIVTGKARAGGIYPETLPLDRVEVLGNASEKSNSGGDIEILQVDEEKGKEVDDQVNLKEKTGKLDQGQVGSDPARTLES